VARDTQQRRGKWPGTDVIPPHFRRQRERGNVVLIDKTPAHPTAESLAQRLSDGSWTHPLKLRWHVAGTYTVQYYYHNRSIGVATETNNQKQAKEDNKK
jgi:hypothetical protein